MRRRRAFALVLLAAVLGAGASSAATRPVPRPPKLIDWCVTKADRRAAIAFRAIDGARLVGVLLGRRASQRGVVLAHESQGGLCNWLAYARRLAGRGYRVLSLDLRGFASSPPTRVRQWRYELDVAGAARELRRRGVQRVVLAGGSLGAMASIVGGATIKPPVDGVVAVSPGSVFVTLDAAAAVPRLLVPTLYVVAAEDGEFTAIARSLHDATASPDRRLVIVPGTGHGNELVRGPAREPVRELIESFLRERTGD